MDKPNPKKVQPISSERVGPANDSDSSHPQEPETQVSVFHTIFISEAQTFLPWSSRTESSSSPSQYSLSPPFRPSLTSPSPPWTTSLSTAGPPLAPPSTIAYSFLTRPSATRLCPPLPAPSHSEMKTHSQFAPNLQHGQGFQAAFQVQVPDPGRRDPHGTPPFQTFNSLKFDWNNTQFHVLVNGFVALADFRAGGVESPMVMEFLIWVISAPKDLVADTAKFVSSDKVEDFNGLAKQALQVVHRVNVGGSKVTPFNDSIWRTWVTDDEYLESNSGSKMCILVAGSTIRMEGLAGKLALIMCITLPE
ncbi:putative receptor-like protein kinase [Prunus yedoensis var. nudiflora]|uniref:Putative receptor-like protein kinase n=1 Tax=Prunus yedoensis var. nudiflora TaxID=2094558 RepID=A0A314UHL7_PRUYE|nr:putative receptor-like protein kinase [Prunus yedoensis var. nudiflora]